MPAASSRSPHLTKATKAFVDAITAENNPPLYTLPPQAARRILADAQGKPIKKLAMDMHDEDLPVGPRVKSQLGSSARRGGRKAADRFLLPRRRLDPGGQGYA